MVADLPALLLDLPEAISLVLVGIVGGRRRDQPRALFAEMIEAPACGLPVCVDRSPNLE
jgi:hypothetical protein